MRLTNVKLGLFLSYGMSLAGWERLGLFARESAVYQALTSSLAEIALVTYGDKSDEAYKKRLGDIRVVCNRQGLPLGEYTQHLAAMLKPIFMSNTAVFKSNQVQGSDVAMRMAQALNKKFVARCGFLLSDFTERQFGQQSPEAQRARELERLVFTQADRVAVTTPVIKERVVKDYRLSENRVAVIPNYVDTTLFRPMPAARIPRRLCTICRLEPQKNLFALLEAIHGLDVEVVIAGNGTQAEQLRKTIKAKKLDVHLLGVVDHRTLPELFNSAEAFILPSHYESHPKVLLEAMACGLPVIGTKVVGIRELIAHGKNGYLCETSPQSIRQAILEVLGDTTLQERMGENAREYIEQRFSLKKVVQMELAMLSEVTGQKS
ncbi:MAG: glycosyltransferase family 4 protein [Myxococcales bacterium]|nr:glycosyltransferase family 4 protein [Myxococcales bacterium]